MTETQTLLERIAGLRERLAPPTDATAQALATNSEALGYAVRSLLPVEEPTELPRQLTAAARRLLQDARELVAEQRRLSFAERMELFAGYHKQTTTLLETSLKAVQNFSSSAEAQLKEVSSVEATLSIVRERCGVLNRAATTAQKWQHRTDELARRLADVSQTRAVDPQWFADMADQLLEEARRGEAIHWVKPTSTSSTQIVAAHALVVAQVLARIVAHDFEWSNRPTTPVAAALLMDVGMVTLPCEILMQSTPISTDQRRLVEQHARQGAAMLSAVFPDSTITCHAVAMHHERPDGTGYPSGAMHDDIPNLAKLLRVADHYAALRSDRPHRLALDARQALTETLLAAEQGMLDREYAELLTQLGLYPVGTVIELTDGRVAVVLANHPQRGQVRAATRPVVAVLTDSFGMAYPRPDYLDLNTFDRAGIERGLTTAERKRFLASHYPEYAS